LKGDRIRPFSETHTFVLVMAKGYWLISAQNIVQQNSREAKTRHIAFGVGEPRAEDCHERIKHTGTRGR
jgi:hypothetical protein